MRLKSSIASWSATAVLVLVVGAAWFSRQVIFDWYRLHNYQPPAAIAKIATDTTMSSQTRRLFYIYHPDLEDRSTFNQHCPNASEKTIVLGCYQLQRGIYLFNVTDPRLAGIEEVTAAHETLHAEYDRLSSSDRAKVNDLINQAYAQVTDERIKSTVEDYRKAGADVTNELHSILGTEVRNLPPALETYYSRYFADRKKIVSFSEQYEKVFTDRKNLEDSYLKQINDIEKQLPALKNEIDAMEISLATQYKDLEQQRSHATDANSFNAQVNAYNAQVAIYRSKVSNYNQLVVQHNDLLKQYNAIALEENELIKAIDSHPSSAQTQ